AALRALRGAGGARGGAAVRHGARVGVGANRAERRVDVGRRIAAFGDLRGEQRLLRVGRVRLRRGHSGGGSLHGVLRVLNVVGVGGLRLGVGEVSQRLLVGGAGADQRGRLRAGGDVGVV